MSLHTILNVTILMKLTPDKLYTINLGAGELILGVSLPPGQVIVHSGYCPVLTATNQCRIQQLQPVRYCDTDSQCRTDEKCCFDTCQEEGTEHFICKRALSTPPRIPGVW